MLVGLAYRDITPEYPMELMGYGDRDHAFESVHDPLYVYALLIKQENHTPFVWFSADLCLFGPDCDLALKRDISRRTGFFEESIYLQGTHTHSAPDAYELHKATEVAEKSYYRLLVEQLSNALEDAMNVLVPAHFEVREGAGAIGVNRRGNGKPIDPRIFLLTIVDEKGTSKGTVFYYSCHLTTLGVENYMVSSDWIGPVRDRFQKRFGIPLMFTQGSEGNVDPYTRGFLDMSDPDQARGVTFESMEELSLQMVGSLIKTMESAPISKITGVTATRMGLELPLRYGSMTSAQVEQTIERWKEGFGRFLGVSSDSIPEDGHINEIIKKFCVSAGVPPDMTKRQVARQFSYTQFLWAYRKNGSYVNAESGTIHINMTIMNFGSFIVVGLPVEPLADINLELKRCAGSLSVVACGLFDGYFGYLPHRKNFDEEGSDSLYETISTVFAPDAAEIIITKALSHIGMDSALEGGFAL